MSSEFAARGARLSEGEAQRLDESLDTRASNEQATPPRDDAVAIRVSNLSKCYQIYDRPEHRLKQSLYPRLQRLAGQVPRKYFREFWAIRDVSLEVKKGETVGIIGRNGSGKSTLLQMICGTLTPTGGTVETHGRVAAVLELGAGFNPEFSGRENVYLNGAVLGLSKEETDARFEDIAAFADIGDFIEQPVKTYSSGMFVRLAFAVQACVDPDILVVDEALAVGDVFFRQKCYRRMRELIDQGTAVILVTHDMGAISQFCQRAMVLNNGHNLFCGNPVTGIRKYFALERGDPPPIREHARSVDAMFDDQEGSSLPTAGRFVWPGTEAFLNLSDISQEGAGHAELTAAAICNTTGESCHVFQIGDAADFYYEFRIIADMEVPIGGISIINDKNIIIHGKNSLQHKLTAPHRVLRGTVLRFRQQIMLDIAPGEYTFVIGLAMIDGTSYDNADHMDYGTLAEKITRVVSVGQLGCFSVTMRREGQALTHHGLCNLPGECALMLLSAQR